MELPEPLSSNRTILRMLNEAVNMNKGTINHLIVLLSRTCTLTARGGEPVVDDWTEAVAGGHRVRVGIILGLWWGLTEEERRGSE